MSYHLCSTCIDNTPCTGISVINLVGQAIASELIGLHGQAEIDTLNDTTVFYHYFYNDAALAQKILQERVVKSRIQCMCINCINNYLHSGIPHYGDGAYGTVNEALCPDETQNPVSISRAHGIDFKNRPYRAVVKLKSPTAFVKFDKTGGVLRSQPELGITLVRGELCAHSIDDAEVIRVEFWNGSDWLHFKGGG